MSHRINRGEWMADETSSLTVAKLKALCVINDLPTSGKKAELVDRLLEAGLTRTEVGLSDEIVEAVAEQAEEEVILSLEDETTISIEEDEPEPAKAVKDVVIEEDEDDVLEAVLVADVVEEEPKEVFTPVATKRQDVADLRRHGQESEGDCCCHRFAVLGSCRMVVHQLLIGTIYC